MNAPAIVSAGGSEPLGQRRVADVADAHPQERAEQLLLDLGGIEVEAVGPDADQAHVEHEVRAGALAAAWSTSAGWDSIVAASISRRSKVVLPT